MNILQVTEALFNMGCYEVSLGDTIGVGGPGNWKRLLQELSKSFDMKRLATHAHDTYGQVRTLLLTISVNRVSLNVISPCRRLPMYL